MPWAMGNTRELVAKPAQAGGAVSPFDFTPGAQVPLTGLSSQNAPTQALSSAAYRDSAVESAAEVTPEVKVVPAKFKLFEPNFGEAFTRALQLRMLSAGRAGMVQSFGADPQAVIAHCLSAARLRRERDLRLTVVMAICGLLFLPGTLVWGAAFQLRRAIRKGSGARDNALGSLVLVVVGIVTLVLALKPPSSGLLALYLRVVLLAPVAGWFVAMRICERTAGKLREGWSGALSGGGIEPIIPEAVPTKPKDTKAEHLRAELTKISEEQNSNVLFYAGRKGVLGIGPRWASWHMAEELSPRGDGEIHPFRSWDVIRAIRDRLTELDRGPLHTGGFPRPPSLRPWVVLPIGEGAGSIPRPTGPEVEGYSMRDFEVQRICNEQQFDSGPRSYLGVQFVLWDGQLVVTMLCSVTVLHYTLRVEVTAYALGPVASSLTSGPAARTKQIAKPIKFWETRTIKLPLVGREEVVRLMVRAPLTWRPTVLDAWGGKLTLPEPFGLRHTWALDPWTNQFMADDVMRLATPVLRAVYSATLQLLDEHGVDTDKFANRSMALSGQVQGAEPPSS